MKEQADEYFIRGKKYKKIKLNQKNHKINSLYHKLKFSTYFWQLLFLLLKVLLRVCILMLTYENMAQKNKLINFNFKYLF